MAIIKYTGLSSFDKDAAEGGSLCVCVKKNYAQSYISSNDSSNFVGAGICIYKGYKFHLTVNGVLYVFNDKGAAANNAATTKFSVGCELKMGSIESAGDIVSRGNVVVTRVGGDNPTRSGDNYDPATETYGEATDVSIDSLNARDHFAVQALQMLLARMEKDPATLSNNEMGYLSDVAYKWAANMMIAAANARANTTNTTPATDTEVAVQSLDSNTEKLLNNIETAIKRTDYVTDTTPAEYLKKIFIGNQGQGGNNERPLFVSSKGYNTIEQAEADGWSYNATDSVWEKDGFEPIESAHTDTGAKTLPTNKISIAELPALIAAIDRLTNAIQNQ